MKTALEAFHNSNPTILPYCAFTGDPDFLVEYIAWQVDRWTDAIDTGTYPDSIFYLPKKDAVTYLQSWHKKHKEITSSKNPTKTFLAWRLNSIRWNTKYFSPRLP